MQKRRVKHLLFKPFQKFFQLQSASGLLLLTAVIIALLVANSPLRGFYEAFWRMPLTLALGRFDFSRPLHFWINDGLMSVFFLIVGLEIKRELWVGELSTPKKAALPFMAALGGMIFPAIIYFALTGLNHPDYLRGWGIPTVTDIAFALGILTLLGKKVPLGLKVFLTALAIVDDLGAILLIALFYSQGLSWLYVGLMALIMALLLMLNRLHVIRPLPYVLLGIALWGATLLSGLHATIAGVLLAITIPSRARINPCRFQDDADTILKQFTNAEKCDEHALMLTNETQQVSVQALENLCEKVQSPLQQMEQGLHPWVSFLILPLFALANAGIELPTQHFMDILMRPVVIGIVAGLFLGKQMGITLFSWLSVRLGWAELPQNVRWIQIYGASILGGIGFTMSLFISVLAFQASEHILSAKIGILLASLLSSVVGISVLWVVLKKQTSIEE